MKTDSPPSSEKKTARQDRISRKERILQDKSRAKRWSKRRRAKSRPLAVDQAINTNAEQSNNSVSDQLLAINQAVNSKTEQVNNSALVLEYFEAKKAILLKEVEEIQSTIQVINRTCKQ